VGSNIK